MVHPKDKSERRRLAEAKALSKPLFRQRKINAKKRQIKLQLEEAEKEDELTRYRYLGDSGELGRLAKSAADDELYTAG